MARLGIGASAAALLLLAAAVVLTSTPAEAYIGGGSGMLSSAAHLAAPCDGELGQCAAAIGDDDEEDGGLLRRELAAARRKPSNKYVSYAALGSNQVPCNKRGQTYYQNCGKDKQVNPYRRGCSAITRCSRNMN
uniref:Rapid alkalinization factor 1 n=1 Tax=Leersia perrieri TaxID=77586 RepID=A0A0D9WDR5_9ORYZ